jgi:hypothetical protein
MSANLEERDVGGYSVAYRRDDTNFPVYVTAALAAVFVTAAWITGAVYWLAFAVAAAGFTYYNMPLLETGRPTIGANQYGIFIQAFEPFDQPADEIHRTFLRMLRYYRS